MILSFNCILQTLKKYWPNDGGMASENIARKVIELITKDFSEFKSDTTYKTIFKKGPSKRAASKIHNHLDDSKKFEKYVDENISDAGRRDLAQDLTRLSGIKMDRGTVGHRCYNLLKESLNLASQPKNKKSPTNGETNVKFSKTVSDENFSTVFRQVSVGQMKSLKNRNIIHAFILKPELLPFRYSNLRKLVISNITSYAIARGIAKDDIAGLQAAQILRQYNKSGVPSNLLGELLTYIFLEHTDHALKIYSRAEVSKISRTIDSEGIYLKSDEEKTQLILGASQLNDSLPMAIENVVNELAMFKNNQSSEMMVANDIIDNSILLTQLGEERSQAVINLMTPDESNFDEIASYGLFIGYKFGTEQDLDNCSQEVAKRRCCKAINEDLQQAIDLLDMAIKHHHWQKSSFYVYLLPFTNAEKDSKSIMKDLIGE